MSITITTPLGLKDGLKEKWAKTDFTCVVAIDLPGQIILIAKRLIQHFLKDSSASIAYGDADKNLDLE